MKRIPARKKTISIYLKVNIYIEGLNKMDHSWRSEINTYTEKDYLLNSTYPLVMENIIDQKRCWSWSRENEAFRCETSTFIPHEEREKRRIFNLDYWSIAHLRITNNWTQRKYVRNFRVKNRTQKRNSEKLSRSHRMRKR